jgi:hypothetical protein
VFPVSVFYTLVTVVNVVKEIEIERKSIPVARGASASRAIVAVAAGPVKVAFIARMVVMVRR